jgi:hypothetical protein
MKLYHSTLAFTFLAMVCLTSLAQTEPERFINLELTGGSHAGHYQIQDSDGCIYDHDWNITYSLYLENPSGNSPDTLGIIILNVPDENNLDAFTLVAGFGDYDTSDYVEFTLDPANTNGTGSLQIDKNGKHALLTVIGKTADGVQMNVTFECLDVLDITGETLPTADLELTFPPDARVPGGSLELTVGDQSYLVQTGAEATCNQSVGEANDLWYEYNPGGSYTGMLLLIHNLEEAKAGTTNFGLSIDDAHYHNYADSNGNLNLTQEGSMLTIHADLISVEGTPIATTITCSLTD